MPRLPPLLLAALVVTGVAAQDNKLHFCGRWVLENPLPPTVDTARRLTVHQSLARVSADGTPMEPFYKELMVEREFQTEVRTARHQIGVIGGVVGGVVAGGSSAAPPHSRHSVRWFGDRLLIESGNYSGLTREDGRYQERTEEWSLDSSGRLVVTIATRSSGAPSTSQTATYRRE